MGYELEYRTTKGYVHMKKLVEDDQKIIELIKRDSSKGMKLLMDHYYGLIYYIVEGKLGDRFQEIEECVADVFMEFYSKIDQVDLTRGSVKGYLAMTASRRAVDRYRKLSSKMEYELEDNILLEQADQDTPEVYAIKDERRQRIYEEINNLGVPDNEMVFRRFFLAQSVKDIADSFGMKSNSVSKRINRALTILKTRLEGYHYE